MDPFRHRRFCHLPPLSRAFLTAASRKSHRIRAEDDKARQTNDFQARPSSGDGLPRRRRFPAEDSSGGAKFRVREDDKARQIDDFQAHPSSGDGLPRRRRFPVEDSSGDTKFRVRENSRVKKRRIR
ncbi:hypothetical protein COLO4_36822 [Corchorus olitorius]|uniref:Uncharacterized protein n=1 Tax=Corchorus olitorius TaxID=93759 RepID=A0A1R3G518_9ROSI|nr:hypothetical protein COLO4_36822 [Corchorus olitorius]